jgi:anti-sigma-K factor RskA
MRYSDQKLIDALAGQYALGGMSRLTRARFERLLRNRADVHLALARWEERLSTLATAVPPIAPSTDVWRRIEARTIRAPALQNTPSSKARSFTHWWWGLGGALSAGLASVLLLVANPQWITTTDDIAMRTGERSPQSYVGVLTDATGRGRLLVSSLRHGKTVTLKVLGAEALVSPAGTPMYLWALPPDAPPLLLATVQSKGVAHVTLPDTSEKLLSKVTKLAVTTGAAPEPASAANAANHLLSGACAKLW